MDESRYMKFHGCRFLLGFVLAFAYLVPITNWQAKTESSQSWMMVNMLLLMSGVIPPWMISAYYMRRFHLLDQHGITRTFFPAPVTGLFATLTVPPIYLIYTTATTKGLFDSDNVLSILLTINYFLTNILIASMQIRQARFLIRQLNRFEERRNGLYDRLRDGSYNR